MKKALTFSLVTAVLCGSVWGADFSLSTGAGGLIGGFFTRYTSSTSHESGKMTQNVNQFNYGGLVFFDATYGELAITIQGGANNYDEVMVEGNDFVERTGDGWETMMGFSLLGKYPFTLTNRFKLFPLLGMEYQIALSERRRPDGGLIYDRTNGILEQDKDGNAFDLSAWNSFWIHVGAGTDFTITGNLFFRGELLYSFRLMTAYENDGVEQTKVFLGDKDPKLSGLTSGPSLRLAIGYRFWSL